VTLYFIVFYISKRSGVHPQYSQVNKNVETVLAGKIQNDGSMANYNTYDFNMILKK